MQACTSYKLFLGIFNNVFSIKVDNRLNVALIELISVIINVFSLKN